MTTKVFIRNDGAERWLAVHLVTVQTLAGRREVVDDRCAMTVAPGSEATLYVHECQEVRVREMKP